MSWLDRLFGRPPVAESKASRVGALISLGWVGLPKWPERDYSKLAREGYQRNVIAYACVRKIATAAATVPLLAYRTGRGGRTEEFEASRVLALLERPNPMNPDGAAWRAALFGHLLIAGNAYVERIDAAGGRPVELHLWRPDRVQVIPGPRGYPIGYEYTVNGLKRRVEVDVDRGDLAVLHLREFHPLDDWYGMPALDPAAFAVDVHTDASRWNSGLLRNAGRPPGAFVYKGDPDGGNALTAEQRAQLEEDIDRKFSGPGNAGRPLVLDGGLEWQAMAMTPVEMDFEKGRAEAARDIARAFGVPPMLLGIPGDNTYSNLQEALRDFYEGMVLPLVDRSCRAFGNWLGAPVGEPDVRLGYDADEISALAPRRAETWKRVQEADFLTVDEKRAAVGYEALPGGAGAKLLVPSSMIPLEDAGATFGDGAEPDDGDDGDEPS